MHFEEWMENVVKAFEIAGVITLAFGSIIALIHAAIVLRRGTPHGAYEAARRGIGQSILLGLEVLIIADIVQTITIDPTIESALNPCGDRAGSNVPQLLTRDRTRRNTSMATARPGDPRAGSHLMLGRASG